MTNMSEGRSGTLIEEAAGTIVDYERVLGKFRCVLEMA